MFLCGPHGDGKCPPGNVLLSFCLLRLALKTSWLSLPEVTFVMVTFPCWSPHFILLLSHSWWIHWELPQLWCLFYKAANPSRCRGVAESSYRKPFCLYLIRESTFQGDSEIRFDWLWALLFVITNSLLRKGWGSHPSHSKIGGFGRQHWVGKARVLQVCSGQEGWQ